MKNIKAWLEIEEEEWKHLDVNEHWHKMKKIMMETAQHICGMSKGPCRHKETWWWNEEVAEAVREKKIKYIAAAPFQSSRISHRYAPVKPKCNTKPVELAALYAATKNMIKSTACTGGLYAGGALSRSPTCGRQLCCVRITNLSKLFREAATSFS